MRTRSLGRDWEGLFSGDPDPRLHLIAFPQLSPACGCGVRVIKITPSSQALAGLWSPWGLPSYSGNSPRAISTVPPASSRRASVLIFPAIPAPSSFVSSEDVRGCKHCWCLSQKALPCAWGYHFLLNVRAPEQVQGP